MPEPSLRYTTVSFHGEMKNSRTYFIRGRNTRHEYRNATGHCDGDPNVPGTMQYREGPLRAIIENHDLHYTFHLDVDAGVYTANRLIDPETLKHRKPLRAR